MDTFNQAEPEISDYYADLGLSQQACSREIKLAFFKLAKQHHPDKKAPGSSIDAHEFRKIREAYECLMDKTNRAAYDAHYSNLQYQWAVHREWQNAQREEEERKRAEEEQRAANARVERERMAMEAERARRMKEKKRATRERAERERMREERTRQADECSMEAARRARERREQAAKERLRIEEERQRAEHQRLRREKEKVAEKRSEEAAKKFRMEQERVAQERLRLSLIEEIQGDLRCNWAKLREAAEHREGESAQPRQPPTLKPFSCVHPQLGWPRKKGRTSCMFCSKYCPKFSFQCPECNATACRDCRLRYCIL